MSVWYHQNKVPTESIHINALLLLSYKDLPQNLKPCFLYMGMFPEDFEISISKLMLLWVAEGFIGEEEEEEEGCPEDVARTYFMELVGRSLIQKKGEDWIGSTCRVHDLLRDMAIRKAKEICFSVYYDGNTTSKLSKAPPHRRLAYVTCGNIPNNYVNPSLRTFCQGATSDDSHPNRQLSASPEKVLRILHEYFSLLRVLDIQIGGYKTSTLQVVKIPDEIGRLIHLRYLGLGLPFHRIVELPETIGSLKALETISVRSCEHITLPKTMTRLKNLKHLIGKFNVMGNWIGRLTDLETLGEISYEQWCGVDTKNIVNLRHLFLAGVPRYETHPTKFYDKFQNLAKLRTLALDNRDASALGSISASEIFKRCPSITHFLSSGMIHDNLADLHEYALNLQVLEMEFAGLQHDTIPSIERLPRLRALRIMMNGDIWGTKQLVCSDGGFSQLRTLKIEIHGACEFVVRDGGLPSLTHLA